LGITPYTLYYKVEATLLEIQISSLSIIIQEGFNGENNHKQWLTELEVLDEKRL